MKPQFWADEAVAELSRDARLLTLGLISFADDEGRFLASTAAINGYVFPHDDLPAAKVRKWLDEVEATGIIRLYSVHRREYGAFPNWSKHQKISHPAPSILPAPPALRVVA